MEHINDIKKLIANDKKIILIIRGLPGSGKTTLGKEFIKNIDNSIQIESDDFHMSCNEYNYNKSNIIDAIHYVQSSVNNCIKQNVKLIILSSVFTLLEHIAEYFDKARKNNYILYTITLTENNINLLLKRNIHNVQLETFKSMKSRFEYIKDGIVESMNILDKMKINNYLSHELEWYENIESMSNIISPMIEI